MDARTSNANRHGARRSALGVGAVAGLVAVVGFATALAHHPGTTVVPPPSPTTSTPIPPGLLQGLGFSVADDPAAHQVVLFGGLDGPDTTSLWNGRRWTLVSPRGSPPARSGAVEAYDPANRMVMLFGGSLASRRSVNDTWAWNGATWRRLDSGINGPPPGQGAQMAWDAATHQMVLVTEAEKTNGAETWTWAGNRWTRQAEGDLDVPVSGDVMAYDPVSDALLLVTPVRPDGTNTLTLHWNGAAWRLLMSNGPALEGMAVDPQDDALLACGLAIYFASVTVESNCWQWEGTDWAPVQVAVPPPASKQMIVEAEVTDIDHARLLMFGWLIRAIPGQAQPLHIWSWDGLQWAQLG